MSQKLTNEGLDQLFAADTIDDALLERLLAATRTEQPLSEREQQRLARVLLHLEAWNHPPAWVLEQHSVPPTDEQLEELLTWSAQIPGDTYNEHERRTEIRARWNQTLEGRQPSDKWILELIRKGIDSVARTYPVSSQNLSMDADIHAFGLDSIACAELVGFLEEKLHVSFSCEEINSVKTVEHLAKLVARYSTCSFGDPSIV